MTPLALAEEVPFERPPPGDLTPPAWQVDAWAWALMALSAGVDVTHRGAAYGEGGVGILMLPCDHCVIDNPLLVHAQFHLGWSTRGLDFGPPWVGALAFVAGRGSGSRGRAPATPSGPCSPSKAAGSST